MKVSQPRLREFPTMAQKPSPSSPKKNGGSGSGAKSGAPGNKGGGAAAKGSAIRKPSANKSK
jgi:hypothetical protein